MENCGNCKYWLNFSPSAPIHPDNQGACRRNPPVPILVPQQHPINPKIQTLGIQTTFPGTRRKDWCGEHARALDTASQPRPGVSPPLGSVSELLARMPTGPTESLGAGTTLQESADRQESMPEKE